MIHAKHFLEIPVISNRRKLPAGCPTSLGGGVSELQWVVSSYTIAFAAFILTAGALGGLLRISLVASRVVKRAGTSAAA